MRTRENQLESGAKQERVDERTNSFDSTWETVRENESLRPNESKSKREFKLFEGA